MIDLHRRTSTGDETVDPEVRPSRAEAAPAWVERCWPCVLGATVLAAVVIRVAYVAQLASGPCLALHRWPDMDMAYFHQEGSRIAAGDWLSERVLPPMHGWHRAVAEKWLQQHPRDLEELRAERTDVDAATALWQRWTGRKVFYVDPLYSYLVALTYAVANPDPRWVVAWQLLLGVLTTVLVVLLTRRLFGPLAGAAAALLTVGYAPLVYYEGILLRETLIVFTSFGLVWLVLRAVDADRWSGWAAFGIASGAAVLLKTTFALEALALAGTAVAAGGLHGRAFARRLGPFAAGLALALVPLVVRNLLVGAPAFAAAGSGAVTFVTSNAVEYEARVGGFFIPERLASILAKSNGSFLAAAIEALRTHGTVASYLRQLWNKLAMAWNWYEVPNNTNFYYFRLHSSVLAALPFTFAIVGPLGAVGWACALARARRAWPAHILALTSLATMLVFYVISRLRLPFAVALIPFAAYAAARTASWITERSRMSWTRAAAALAATVALAVWTNRDRLAGEPTIRPFDYVAAFQVHYAPAVRSAIASGDWARAAALTAEHLRDEPRALLQVRDDRWNPSYTEAVELVEFGKVRQGYAALLERLGDPAAATQRELAARMIARAERAGVSF